MLILTFSYDVLTKLSMVTTKEVIFCSNYYVLLSVWCLLSSSFYGRHPNHSSFSFII